MPNSTIITDAELQKALEMLHVYQQVYSFAYQTLPIDPEALEYFKTLPKEDWIVPIQHNGSRFGGMSKRGNVLRVTLTGVFSNLWNLLDCMRLNYDQSFYGISTFVTSTFARFYHVIHYQMQNALLANPQIDKIQIIGYSYGTALGQIMSVVLHKIIKFHKLSISPEGYNSVTAIYSNYLLPHMNSMLSLNPNDPLSKAVRSNLLQNSLTSQSLLDTLYNIDRELFSRVELESTHTFATLPTFTDTVLIDPDLGLAESASVFHLGNQAANDLFSNTYGYFIANDPIPAVLDSRTLAGGLIARMNNDPGRSLIGKVVILNSDSWMPSHTYNHYINTVYRSTKNRDKLNVYSHLTVPVTQPFPLLGIPYICIHAILSGTISNVFLGLIGLVVYACIIALLCVLTYNILLSTLSWFGMGQ